MTIERYRIDDRLIHGQIVVGWGQPLGLGFIVLVDDEVAASDWEQELYRMGVSPHMEVYFASVEEAVGRMESWRSDERAGMLLTGDIETMCNLIERVPDIRAVDLGGIHHLEGRRERLRYVYLTPAEEDALNGLVERGVDVNAQDVPAARPIPLADVLTGHLAR